jgi:hypothetical protein
MKCLSNFQDMSKIGFMDSSEEVDHNSLRIQKELHMPCEDGIAKVTEALKREG